MICIQPTLFFLHLNLVLCCFTYSYGVPAATRSDLLNPGGSIKEKIAIRKNIFFGCTIEVNGTKMGCQHYIVKNIFLYVLEKKFLPVWNKHEGK